jgi:hypothetical protein
LIQSSGNCRAAGKIANNKKILTADGPAKLWIAGNFLTMVTVVFRNEQAGKYYRPWPSFEKGLAVVTWGCAETPRRGSSGRPA